MVSAQTAFTLQACQDSAVNHYPNLKQFELISTASELRTKNIKTNYYPKLNLNGQASYQSDVTKMPFGDNLPPGLQVEELDKDWYKINLDIEQMIYDGGLTSGQKKLEETELLISGQKLEVELYQLKDKVNHLFFNIVYLNKNKGIIEVLIKNLQSRVEDAQNAFENGMLLSSDIDAIRVEMKMSQLKVIELEEDISALIASMNEISGLQISNASQLEFPDIEISDYIFENNRPEYLLLSL